MKTIPEIRERIRRYKELNEMGKAKDDYFLVDRRKSNIHELEWVLGDD
jgi:hypothetical protein